MVVWLECTYQLRTIFCIYLCVNNGQNPLASTIQGTAKRTMSALLEKLVTWALENNVPVEECVWSMTAGALNCILEDEAADGSLVFPIDDVEDTILTFLYDGVKCPMLVLFGEGPM